MRWLGLVFAFLLWALPGWASDDRLVFSGAICVNDQVITLADLAQAHGEQAQAFLEQHGAEPVLAAPDLLEHGLTCLALNCAI